MVEKNQILVVDDQETNRAIIAEMLKEQYIIIQASNGLEAVEIIKEKENTLALILLDLMMPVMDGFGVLDFMNREELVNKIPVILITADNTSDSELKAYEYNVVDVILKPFDPDVVMRRIKNTVDLFEHKNNLEHLVRKQTKSLQEKNEELKRQSAKLRETSDFVAMALGTVVEFRNLESKDHIRRMKYFTKVLAAYVSQNYPEYGLTMESIDLITSASALHDIGKIIVPEKILFKPGKLTPQEFYEVKKHTVYGTEILKDFDYIEDKEFYQYCYEICRSHHERWDGSGYPDGLSEDETPISAQIVALADVYDALVSKRIYKDAFAHNNAVYMIMNQECGVFSPKILDCFDMAREDFQNIIFIRNFMNKQI